MREQDLNTLIEYRLEEAREALVNGIDEYIAGRS